jgi:dephospho-CoA kinase
MFPLEKIGANANIKVIGITGSISSGKSTLLSFLNKMGFTTYSVDKILDNLYKTNVELKEKIVAVLGNDVLANQILDKKRIAEKVFNHRDLLHKVEELTTPFVLDEIKKAILTAKGSVAVEVPLLFELNMQGLFDITILVKGDKKLRKERSSFSDFERRDDRFMKCEDKERLATITISNNGSKADFTHSIQSSMEGI